MASKQEYDVLRFIEHNQICHISSDVVEGYPLVQWLKFHPYMRKELFFQWVQSMARQLADFYKCRGTMHYQYVNPYSLIVSEDQKIYFLDLNAKSNEKQLKKMQRRMIREHFLPPQNQYYQNASEEMDIYGFGKTLQYLLSVAELETDLSKTEERKFRKLIQKCLKRNSKKSIQQISEIQKYVPQLKPNKERKKLNRKSLYLVVGMLTVVIAVKFFPGAEPEKAEKISEIKAEETVKISQSQEEKELYEELGMLYFQEFQDYKRSKEYFERIEEDKVAEKMAELSECLMQENVSESILRDILQELESVFPETKKDYYNCLFQGYIHLTSEEDKENLLRIGTLCLETAEDDWKIEVQTRMAAVYEEKEMYDEAVQFYAQILTQETEAATREDLYLKLATLLCESEKNEEALQILQDGIQEYKDSVNLRISYMQIQCHDSSIDRESLIQMMNEQLKQCRGLQKSEEFLKLLKECGMEIKGGNVCQKE